jgi:tetratricopeptide (TPR) repeat protein
MKAEHRKELVTNTLASRLGEAVQTMKEGPSRGTILVLVGAGLVVILALVWHYLSTSAEETDSARWLRWDELRSPEELQKLAEDKELQGQTVGRLARLAEARKNLHDGLRDLGSVGTIRKQAQENIQKAAELYDKLADEFTDKPLLHQQILLGAAKAHESMGDIKQARKFYEQLTQKYKDTALGKDADEQLKRLDAAEQNGDLKALRDEYNKPVTP